MLHLLTNLEMLLFAVDPEKKNDIASKKQENAILSLILFFCFARRAAVVHWSCWTFRGQSLRLHKKIINIKKRNRSLELHSMPLGSYCSIYITTTVSLNVRRAPTDKGGGFQL